MPTHAEMYDAATAEVADLTARLEAAKGRQLQAIHGMYFEDSMTASGIAKRTGISDPTVRSILRVDPRYRAAARDRITRPRPPRKPRTAPTPS